MFHKITELKEHLDLIKEKNNRKEIFNVIQKYVGKTPVFKINKIPIPNNNRIWVKEEWLNPTGSHYDRVYYELYKIDEFSNKIKPGITTLIENTTGNAGSSFAWLGELLGYSCTVIIPEDMPKNRIKDIEKYHPKEIIFSPKGEYVKGANKTLKEILIKDRKKKGKSNPKAHYCLNHSMRQESILALERCGNEIVEQCSKIDIFVGAIGNGTSITGISRILKKKYGTKIIGWDPEEAPVGYALIHPEHKFEFHTHNVYGAGAWGVKFKNLELPIINEIRLAKANLWKECLRQLVYKENKPVGYTSAASLSIALEMCKEVTNKDILIVFYDPLSKYDNLI